MRQSVVVVEDPNVLLKDVVDAESMFSFFSRRLQCEVTRLRHAVRRCPHFERDVLPSLLSMARQEKWFQEEEQKKISVLEKGASREVKLACGQVGWLLANSFFCNVGSFERCGSLDWTQLYVTELDVAEERLLCLFDYFAQLPQAIKMDPEREIIFLRGHYEDVVENPEWPSSELVVETSHMRIHTDSMEKYAEIKKKEGREKDCAFVDFANRRIHIHRIIPSLTQEEVIFSCCSEMMILLLMTETLADDEYVVARNVWRHSHYSGYLDTFKWEGPLAKEKMHLEEILAIDAVTGNHYGQSVRDMRKCYACFVACQSPSISTGRWGCGVFGGDPTHKMLQQMMCAQLAHKTTLWYSSYKNEQEKQRYQQVIEMVQLKRPTFAQMMRWMTQFKSNNRNASSFHQYILNELENIH